MSIARLGLDMFSLRSQTWTPFEQLDFCARWGVRVAHYSEIRLLGGLDSDHLRRVRAHADALGILAERSRVFHVKQDLETSMAGVP